MQGQDLKEKAQMLRAMGVKLDEFITLAERRRLPVAATLRLARAVQKLELIRCEILMSSDGHDGA